MIPSCENGTVNQELLLVNCSFLSNCICCFQRLELLYLEDSESQIARKHKENIAFISQNRIHLLQELCCCIFIFIFSISFKSLAFKFDNHCILLSEDC